MAQDMSKVLQLEIQVRDEQEIIVGREDFARRVGGRGVYSFRVIMEFS